MESNKIRQLFLDFFKEKGHEIVSSSPLLPKDDPTLLFTNAGMVQFKTVFLGEEVRPYKRAVTVQKCLRAGGKHNDLENVGRTARHHTFFEMLGNFSFGDYFKKEATEWAWELLTERMKLPADKLYITVYEKDDEAADIWKNHVGIPAERIYRLGEKDNFWQMGDTGPCGPCSEILIDQGAGLSCGKPTCSVGCDCDRYLEIWNLVFMQYNRDSSGNLTPLPKPSIDTGMGLERLSAVLQGKHNNFDSDLFMPIIRTVEKISGKKYGVAPSTSVSMRVIADHIRSAAFVISEGLFPSNEGRGYVLRRIIRRAARHGFMLGIEDPFLYNLLDTVNEIMSGPYPELLEATERNKKILKLEEERFAHTLSSGMGILNKLMDDLRSSGKDTIPGAELFKLYDTFGFPVDLAQDIAEDNKFVIDLKGFNDEMELQKTRARASWVGEEEVAGVYRDIKKQYGATEFSGYEALRSDSIVNAIIRDGALVEEAGEGDEVEIVMDKTPFYGESGGQVGDKGKIKADGLRIEVLDTKKFSDILIHNAAVRKGTIRKGMTVSAIVDEERRKAIMRNHTATHLLHSALRAVLGDHIKQAGSLVTPERLRFDFTHFYAVDDREISEVEEIVNEQILKNLHVIKTATTLDDAISKGVIALFGEKYGKRVRVVQAGDFSAELCGGTHSDATGEIGLFKITSEGSVAAGIRRIEAVTGFPAIEYYKERERELIKAASLLKIPEQKVSERVEKIIGELKQQEKELEKFRQKAVKGKADAVLESVVSIDDIKVLARKIDGLDMKALRDLADNLKNKLGSGVILLASSLNGQACYVSAVTKDLTSRFHAGDILKAVTGGKGGGRPDMAQGGTKDVEGIEKAVGMVVEIIKQRAGAG
ncbi:MAG: alanine--tRNA ligase [Nitrospiraceae bacterium]|nr:MAG: alanine--tRNA ligase [Nitrospiraceae bacterium]